MRVYMRGYMRVYMSRAGGFPRPFFSAQVAVDGFELFDGHCA